MELINFKFDTKFLKMETDFIRLILFTLETRSSNDYTLHYDKDFLLKKLKFSEEKLFKVLDNLMIKRFSYTLAQEGKKIFGKFSFINSYRVDGDEFTFILGKEIFEIYIPNSIFYESDMENLLCLKSNKSVLLYLKVSSSKKSGTGFEISLDELKDFLEIETEYSRFYDFERFVIKDVIDDINENSFSKISYQKIKKGTSSTHRVESLVFYMLNRKQVIIKEETNELLELVKYRVKDLSTIHHIIRSSIKKYGYLYTKENINFVLENKKRDVDLEVIRALKENPVNHSQELITGRASSLILSIDKYFPSTYDFKTFLYYELQKLGFVYSDQSHYVEHLKKFDKTHFFEFEDEKIKINAYYTDMGPTKLRVYSKE